MVKHTQTFHRQLADELSVFDYFVGLALTGLIFGMQPSSKCLLSRFQFWSNQNTLSTHAEFSEKLVFLTSRYTAMNLRIRGLKC